MGETRSEKRHGIHAAAGSPHTAADTDPHGAGGCLRLRQAPHCAADASLRAARAVDGRARREGSHVVAHTRRQPSWWQSTGAMGNR